MTPRNRSQLMRLGFSAGVIVVVASLVVGNYYVAVGGLVVSIFCLSRS